MTNFERKPGDKKNANSKQIDPVKELTRLLGHKNLSADWQKSTGTTQTLFVQKQSNDLNNTVNNNSKLNQNENFVETDHSHSDWLENNNPNDHNDIYDHSAPQMDNDGENAPQWLDRQSSYNSPSENVYENNHFPNDNQQKYDLDDSQGMTNEGQKHAQDGNINKVYGQQEPYFYDDSIVPEQKQFNNNHSDPEVNDYAPPYDHSDDENSSNVYSAHQFNAYGESHIAINKQENAIANDIPFWVEENLDEEVEEQLWSHPLDETDTYNHQSSVYGNESQSHFSSNEQSDEKQDFIDESSSYSDGSHSFTDEPEFVNDLSQDQNTIENLSSENENQDYPQQAVDDLDGFYVRLGTPYKTVTSPLFMATKAHSFLGYGQAVTILPQKESSNRSNKPVSEPGINKEKSNFNNKNKTVNQSLFKESKSKVNNTSSSNENHSLKTTKAQPYIAENLSSNSDFQAGVGFEDALNDFNLTIKEDKKKRYRRDTSVKIVRPDQNAVPETKSFDLPPVRYNDVENSDNQSLSFDQEFSDVLASGVADAPAYSYNELEAEQTIGSLHHNEQLSHIETLQNVNTPLNENAIDASKYNWSAEQDNNAPYQLKPRSLKKLYLLASVLIVLVIAALSYYFLIYNNNSLTEPAIIHRDSNPTKIFPQVQPNNAANQDPTIYNNNENVNKQSELVDHSESPVDLDKVEEKKIDDKANPNQSSLEQNPIYASVLEVIKNSVPIHEVPTINLENKELSKDTINSAIINEKEKLLAAGETFKKFLAEQNEVQQAPSSSDLLANSQSDIDKDTKSNSRIAQIDNNIQIQNTNNELPKTAQSAPPVSQAPVASAPVESVVSTSTQPVVNTPVEQPVNTPTQPVETVANTPVEPASKAPVQMSVSSNLPQENNVQKNNTKANQIATTLPSGVFFVQIASHPTMEAAQQSFVDIQKQYPQFNSLIGERKVAIISAEIPNRGIYYRVRIATNSLAEANKLCSQLKKNQLSCFIGK